MFYNNHIAPTRNQMGEETMVSKNQKVQTLFYLHVNFPDLHVYFSHSHVYFSHSHVYFSHSHVYFSDSHVYFSDSHVYFSDLHVNGLQNVSFCFVSDETSNY